MTKTYRHLTHAAREEISVLHSQGFTDADIGKVIGCHKSTVSRELARNASVTYGCYRAHRAEQRSAARRSAASRHQRLKNDTIRSYVREKLAEDWTPELISGRLLEVHPGLTISPEAIYQYVYAKDTPDREKLIAGLPRQHRKRKPKGNGRKSKKVIIPSPVSIDHRPLIVEDREETGHWETDSMVSSQSKAALNTLVERTCRLTYITKLPRKTAEHTAAAIIRRLKHLPPEARRTLTLDNGTENAGHQDITSAIKIQCYFAHPYHSWERGSNEQVNGLIRRYLPKGTDFSMITDQRIKEIENKLNNRPRKCLGFKTPFEAAALVALHG
jgi:transposase, IS30 family